MRGFSFLVFAEDYRCRGRKGDHASALHCLWLTEDETAVPEAMEAAIDMNCTQIKIDVTPAQGQQFTASHSRVEAQVENRVPLGALRLLEESPQSLLIEDLHVWPFKSGRGDRLGGIPCEDAELNSGLERAVEGDVVMPDCPRR